MLLSFKGYVCHKMITSKNVNFVTWFKDFLFHEIVMFRSSDIHNFKFQTIPLSLKVVT